MIDVHHGDAERALHLQQGLLHGRLEIALVVGLDEMGEHFRVGLGLELVARFQQPFFQQQVVFNNAIVDQEELAAAIRVRVSIHHAGLAVRGPARVGDSRHALGSGVPHLAFEFGDLADGPGKIGRAIRNENAARIVAAVLQPLQSLNQDFLGRLISRVRHDSTHRLLPRN